MSDVPDLRDLPPDRMSAGERMAALRTRGARPDRVPFIPRVYGYPMPHCGWPVCDAYQDAARSFRGRLKLQELVGSDDPFAFYAYASMCSWEFGGQVSMPTGEYESAPKVLRYPVTSEDDLDRLRVPDDVLAAGSVPVMLAFARLQDAHGLPVSLDLGTPFTDAANVVEPSLFYRWLIKRPDLAHHCLRLVTDFFLELVAAWMRLFPGRVIVGFDGMPGEANTLISPRQFQTFALPYMHELHEKALRLGVSYFSTHACGDQNANLESLRAVPFGCDGHSGMVSFGHEVGLRQAIDAMSDQVVVMGNVDPTELHLGSAERVWELAREAVFEGKDAPLGFVLMSGCEVSVGTPLCNLLVMHKAARAFGRY